MEFENGLIPWNFKLRFNCFKFGFRKVNRYRKELKDTKVFRYSKENRHRKENGHRKEIWI